MPLAFIMIIAATSIVYNSCMRSSCIRNPIYISSRSAAVFASTGPWPDDLAIGSCSVNTYSSQLVHACLARPQPWPWELPRALEREASKTVMKVIASNRIRDDPDDGLGN